MTQIRFGKSCAVLLSQANTLYPTLEKLDKIQGFFLSSRRLLNVIQISCDGPMMQGDNHLLYVVIKQQALLTHV